MLRVIASLPFTWGCPKLFQATKPPHFLILSRGTKEKANMSYCFTPLPLSLSTISVTSYWCRMRYRGPKLGDWGLAFAVWRAPQKGRGLVGWVLTREAQCISSGLGSNLAVLDKSEPCGYGSVPSPSYADLTAKTIYAHASPLNGTKLINWSCATFCQLRGGLRVLCSTLRFLPGPTQQQNTSTSWPSLCPGSHIISWQVPFLLLLSFWSMVNGEFHGLSLST